MRLSERQSSGVKNKESGEEKSIKIELFPYLKK